MSVISNNQLAGASGQGGSSPPASYQISRSIRFNSGDSSYLSRTPSSAGNQRTWSWSGWLKRSKFGGTKFGLFTQGNVGIIFDDSYGGDRIRYVHTDASINKYSNVLFRDPSAWLHLVVVLDTTNSTLEDRLRFYVNNVRVTDWHGNSLSGLTQNVELGINSAAEHVIGRFNNGSYFDGYLADVHFIDGQALAPTDFGEYDTNNLWQAKEFTGSYGSNGYNLTFSDNSSASALGTDSSGNSNNWSTTNLSVAAGTGNDSLIDTPENYTAGSGNNGGNYSTWNPLNSGSTLSNGNLDATTTSTGYALTYSTIGVSSGKWYWEVTPTSLAGATEIGITKAGGSLSTAIGSLSFGYCYLSNSLKGNNNSYTSYGTSYAVNDIIGVALDLDAGTLVFYKNGVSQGTAYSSLSGQFFAAISDSSNSAASSISANFGQRPFAYTPPTNHKSLCTTNLPTPTIADGSTAMDAVLYTGNGSTQSVTGYSFSPDLVWAKRRDGTGDHQLYDIVRGVNIGLSSNLTSAEWTYSGGLSAFNSNGFSAGGLGGLNGSGHSQVAWAWNAGSSTTSISVGGLNSSAYDQSQTWSTYGSFTGTTWSPAVGTLFNGSLSDGPSLLAGQTGTYTFTSGITASTSIEIYAVNGSNASQRVKLTVDGTVHEINGAGNTWINTGLTGSLTAITISVAAGWGSPGLRAIKVDGKMLVDNGTSVTNVPTIASTVRANPSVGFSICKYTSPNNSGNQSFGHGLNAKPDFVIVKNLDSTYSWDIYHSSLGYNASLVFGTSTTRSGAYAYEPTTIVVSTKHQYTHNGTDEYVALCWSAVEGYSSFGSYTGNGSTNGPFVYTGFRPRWILIKNADSVSNWLMYDTARDTFNVANLSFQADSSVDETNVTNDDIDILSNGFKIRSSRSDFNNNADQHVYAAFAEHPFSSNGGIAR